MTERAQRRGRAIAMTAAEVDEFLADERTCRVATAGKDGRPHVVPLWFVWDGTALWLSSVVRPPARARARRIATSRRAAAPSPARSSPSRLNRPFTGWPVIRGAGRRR
jgi:hypothetical protein